MSQTCQCCLKTKSTKKLKVISDRVKKAFDDLFGNFSLNYGLICRLCRRNLMDVNRFKKKIKRKHEKNSEETFYPEIESWFSEGDEEENEIEVARNDQEVLEFVEPQQSSPQNRFHRGKYGSDYDRVDTQLNRITIERIPSQCLKLRAEDDLVEIDKGADGSPRFAKQCPVIGCQKVLTMKACRNRVRHEAFKMHLDRHFESFSNQGKQQTKPLRNRKEIKKTTAQSSSEFVVFNDAYESRPEIKTETIEDDGSLDKYVEDHVEALETENWSHQEMKVEIEPAKRRNYENFSNQLQTEKTKEGKYASIENEFKCDRCKFTSNNKRNLYIHQNVAHRDRDDFICIYCESIFTTYELLREHYREVHRGHSQRDIVRKRDKTRVLCIVCGKMIMKVLMKKHVATVHNMERNYKCTDCDKAFSALPGLNRHRLAHHNGGLRPFQCDICGRNAASKYDLSKHIFNVHCPERARLKCKFCEKGFHSRSDLKKHMSRNVHTDNEVDMHLKARPDTNRFHCPYCDRRYVNKVFLGMHIRKMH